MTTSRFPFRWVTALGLSVSAFVFGACFHIGDQTGTCAPGTTCTCDGIGNCEEHCPGGHCHFSCTGVGNCNVVCEGGNCDLSCSGTGNCNLDCQGGNCTSNCLGRTNCICRNCSEFDASVPGSDTGASDTGATVDANASDAFSAVDTGATADTGNDAAP